MIMSSEQIPLGAYTATIPCGNCGAEIKTWTEANLSDPETEAMVRRFWAMARCGKCHGETSLRDEKEKARERVREWENFCPVDFRQTTLERLPRRKKYERAMEWKFGARGLLLHGPSGLGKSRTAWKICEREFLIGRTVEVIDANFAQEYAAKLGARFGATAEWIGQKCEASVLLMDDVFKAKLTDAIETALFAVMEERLQNRRPLIVTLNDTGATLKGRLSQDRGEPIVRRLREHCEAVSFV